MRSRIAVLKRSTGAAAIVAAVAALSLPFSTMTSGDQLAAKGVTFTRSGLATQYDSTGKLTYAPNNLIHPSEDITGYYYENGATITGPTTATLPSTGNIGFIGFPAVTAGENYIGSVELAGTGIVYLRFQWLDGATYPFANDAPITLTSTPTRYSFKQTVPGGGVTGMQFRVCSDSGATLSSVSKWQMERVTYQTTPRPYVATTSAAYYAPRFDYDPVTLAPKGLLIEEARTNLALQSNTFASSPWAISGAAPAASASLAPDGNYATTLTITTAGNCYIYQPITVTSGVVYTASVWARVTSGTGKVYLSTDGAVTNGVACALTTTWQRFTNTFTSSNSQHFVVIGQTNTSTDASPSIEIFGAQFELGSFATSYIPTTSASVTRAAETASMTGTNFSSWYNQSEGTFVCEFDAQDTNLCWPFIADTLGGGSDFVDTRIQGGHVVAQVAVGGVAGSNLSIAPYTQGSLVKTAHAYKTNDFAGCSNGGTPVTDTSGAVPVSVDRLFLGYFNTAYQINGHIKSLTYFNTRKTNAELQALTS